MIDEFERRTGFRKMSILGRDKCQSVVYARFVYWFVMKRNGFSITEIARLCDRNHATIIYGLRRVNELLEIHDVFVCELVEKTKNIKR